ncbi:hypothetical protein VTJ49DRAFT_2831 [Mycothermus thermophilus]|uniref:UDP-N-acetylglucosamine transferase subunit ALG14 n=1 Tax=Humicola insolens TaxID=85995 RepID=A0ABR3VA80_HUMIN
MMDSERENNARPGAEASSQNQTERSLPETFILPTDNITTSTGDNTTTSRETPISTVKSGEKKDDIEMDLLRTSVHDMRPQRFAVYVYSILVGLAAMCGVIFCLLPWSWITALLGIFASFVVWRHVSIKRSSPRPSSGRRWVSHHPSPPPPPTTYHLPAVHFLYVLGSGGHTSEMLQTIKRQFSPQRNLHRRYLITLGDHDSLRRLCEFEDLLLRSVPDIPSQGTWDVVWVPRARRVHQPLWTAPFTCFHTAIWTVAALVQTPDLRRIPPSRGGNNNDPFRYPHVIVTNGPGTGFIVCLVAHLLKLFYIVPQNRARMVYAESWARSRTLSLTGRLFLWTGLADMFCVQHRELERRYGAWGAVYAGNMGRPLPPSPSSRVGG